LILENGRKEKKKSDASGRCGPETPGERQGTVRNLSDEEFSYKRREVDIARRGSDKKRKKENHCFLVAKKIGRRFPFAHRNQPDRESRGVSKTVIYPFRPREIKTLIKVLKRGTPQRRKIQGDKVKVGSGNETTLNFTEKDNESGQQSIPHHQEKTDACAGVRSERAGITESARKQ